MKNFEYWKESLGEVLPDRLLTTKEVKDIMSVSEMEYEYTEHESHALSEPKIRHIETELEKENRVLKDYIAKIKKVDSVNVVGNEVELYNKLP